MRVSTLVLCLLLLFVSGCREHRGEDSVWRVEFATYPPRFAAEHLPACEDTVTGEFRFTPDGRWRADLMAVGIPHRGGGIVREMASDLWQLQSDAGKNWDLYLWFDPDGRAYFHVPFWGKPPFRSYVGWLKRVK